MWQPDLLWFFDRRRYFHLHANQCWRSRSISQRRKHTRSYRNSNHHVSIANYDPQSPINSAGTSGNSGRRFQELIRMSSASNYREELVTGPGGLLSRGLLEEQATKYGALPPTKRDRSTLAAMLSTYVENHFPDYAKLYSGAGVIGVPGFWQDP